VSTHVVDRVHGIDCGQRKGFSVHVWPRPHDLKTTPVGCKTDAQAEQVASAVVVRRGSVSPEPSCIKEVAVCVEFFGLLCAADKFNLRGKMCQRVEYYVFYVNFGRWQSRPQFRSGVHLSSLCGRAVGRWIRPRTFNLNLKNNGVLMDWRIFFASSVLAPVRGACAVSRPSFLLQAT
jgi:hypothetical protein